MEGVLMDEYGYLTVEAMITNLKDRDPKARIVGYSSGRWYFGSDLYEQEMHVDGAGASQQPYPCHGDGSCSLCLNGVPKERMLVL
jgi:hypothetical protein